MKALKLLAAASAAIVALLAFSPPAEAHGRVRGGVTFQFGYGHYWPGYWWGPAYWGPRYRYLPPPLVFYDLDDPYAYGPTVVIRRADPPVYIEREPPAADPAVAEPPAWWYWCPGAKAYYPYVRECPGGWQRVPPQPVDKQ